MQVATGDSYQIRGRTMSLEEWELNVQVENPVDFISLAHHGCELGNYYQAQDLDDYFFMLNGPSNLNLVKHFWVRAEIYDLHAAKLEEHEKVLIDPTLEGKTREQLGLKPFTCTEIRSSIMGIPITITEEVIARAIRRTAEGSFEEGLDDNKISPWNDVVNMIMFNSTKKGKYCDLNMDFKLLMKIMNENLLPKGGGGDQPSLDHKVFLHFFMTLEKANVPKYISNHMMQTLKESQNNKRSWIAYGRLMCEIFHQGGILKALKQTKIITNAQLGTVTRKFLNGCTLRKMHLIKKEDFQELKTDLNESFVLSNLMDDFPPICRQDPLDVRANIVYEHYKRIGETIRFDDIPKTMYGGALLVARKKKSKMMITSEAVEPKKKKAKKAKDAPKQQATDSVVPTIQDEVQDLEPTKVLNKRTRNGKLVGSSQRLPPQPSIPKKKRKHHVRKLKVSDYMMEGDDQVEVATDLVTRDVRRKRATDEATLQKASEIAQEIGIPTEDLVKQSTVEAAHKVIELTENLQQLVVAGDLLDVAEEIQRKEAAC